MAECLLVCTAQRSATATAAHCCYQRLSLFVCLCPWRGKAAAYKRQCVCHVGFGSDCEPGERIGRRGSVLCCVLLCLHAGVVHARHPSALEGNLFSRQAGIPFKCSVPRSQPCWSISCQQGRVFWGQIVGHCFWNVHASGERKEKQQEKKLMKFLPV
jgi:hypothetical protein